MRGEEDSIEQEVERRLEEVKKRLRSEIRLERAAERLRATKRTRKEDETRTHIEKIVSVLEDTATVADKDGFIELGFSPNKGALEYLKSQQIQFREFEIYGDDGGIKETKYCISLTK